MESLRLAIEMLDPVAEAETDEQSVDTKKEARRLLRRHPDADVNEEELAEVLRQELARPGSIM